MHLTSTLHLIPAMSTRKGRPQWGQDTTKYWLQWKKKNFTGALWILSRSAIKAMGLTSERFKRRALRGYYLTCGWYLNKKHVLYNREGYIRVLTYTASWHGLGPLQWIKTATTDHFHPNRDLKKGHLYPECLRQRWYKYRAPFLFSSSGEWVIYGYFLCVISIIML